MTAKITSGALLTGVAALLLATPARADVKTGLDAWARGDFTTAVAEWRPLAAAGDADAQFNLGQAYKFGRGVPIDLAQAQSWFKRAADQGHVRAQDNYGIVLHQLGRRAEALPWLERSAARGEPRAQLVLGTMLFNGDSVKADYPRAYALMTRASQQNLPSASQSLARMDGFISVADREQGRRLAQQYAAREHVAQQQARATSAPTAAVPAPINAPIQATPTRTAAAAPAPAPAARQSPTSSAMFATATAASALPGGWRVQLGAFRDRGNAEALWTRLRGKLAGAQPDYVPAGDVTRLQATGFADQAAARRACAAVGVSCLVIAP